LHSAWIYLLKRKSKAFDAFKLFKAMVEKQYSAVIRLFHEDKGGKYIGHKWDTFCGEHGIWRKHTTRATPQQNGVAERKNCTLAVLLLVTWPAASSLWRASRVCD
jgi:transposase InsO family protein